MNIDIITYTDTIYVVFKTLYLTEDIHSDSLIKIQLFIILSFYYRQIVTVM